MRPEEREHSEDPAPIREDEVTGADRLDENLGEQEAEEGLPGDPSGGS